MKTQTKVLGAGAIIVVAYLMWSKKTPQGNVSGISVTKTTSECSDPNSIGYAGAAACNASTSDTQNLSNAAADTGSALGKAFGSFFSSLGMGGSNNGTVGNGNDPSNAASSWPSDSDPIDANTNATNQDDLTAMSPGAAPTIGNNPDVSQSRPWISNAPANRAGTPHRWAAPLMSPVSYAYKSRSVPGGDGPQTRPLQMPTGLGTRIDDRYSEARSTNVTHR